LSRETWNNCRQRTGRPGAPQSGNSLIVSVGATKQSAWKKRLNHNEHNEHNEHQEKPRRLVSPPHPTAELHALGKVSLLFVLVVVNWLLRTGVYPDQRRSSFAAPFSLLNPQRGVV
jgi:hypothetical protein